MHLTAMCGALVAGFNYQLSAYQVAAAAALGVEVLSDSDFCFSYSSSDFPGSLASLVFSYEPE